MSHFNSTGSKVLSILSWIWNQKKNDWTWALKCWEATFNIHQRVFFPLIFSLLQINSTRQAHFSSQALFCSVCIPYTLLAIVQFCVSVFSLIPISSESSSSNLYLWLVWTAHSLLIANNELILKISNQFRHFVHQINHFSGKKNSFEYKKISHLTICKKTNKRRNKT